MAIGDDAVNAGMPLVPDTGEAGRIRWGAQEINRTRDFIAQTREWVGTTKTRRQRHLGIYRGTGPPWNHSEAVNEGDLYFRPMIGSDTNRLVVYTLWGDQWYLTSLGVVNTSTANDELTTQLMGELHDYQESHTSAKQS